eukprot:gene16135-19198_t
MSKIAAIIGVGPGIGSAVAKKFAAEGYTVALASRQIDKLLKTEKEINDAGGKAISVAIDVSQEDSIVKGFDHIKVTIGTPSVLIYNVGTFKMGSVETLTTADYEAVFKANCLGAIVSSKQVLSDMVANHSGTIIFTGATASLRGSSKFSAFAVGKFALRAFAQSLAREYHPQGIHISHVIIDGQVNTGADTNRPLDEMLSPTDVANQYYSLHKQDRTIWTHELELRPYKEKF